MSTHHGKLGVIKIGANVVGEVQEFSVSEQANTVDDTQMGDTAESHLVGINSWSGTLKALWDASDAGQTALTVGASVTLNLYPEGTTTGLHMLTGTATVTQLQTSVNRAAANAVSFDFKGNGVLTKQLVP